MNPERWQKVKGLFDGALALAPERRETFLKKACGADDELRLEVENLLVSFDEAENFMDQPAAAEVASLIIEENEKIKSGGLIAHYETLWKIGEGGMGEVYLAKDTRLGRKVALKLLPANLTADRSRLRRFKQEAQAASALNHPNIITIYEIREFGETHLIATEFVEGKTLRQKMSSENLKIPEILDISVQVASALSVAHNAGVIHRDIKPENIMIRPDGIVKLLDFGLAKLAETSEAKSPDISTKKLTNPGMVMGTVNYMSPEQAQGKPVDHRTDLWSLGVCLYEMVTGKIPFSGKTINHTLVAIMENQPPPIAQSGGLIYAKLEKIVAGLLEKKAENRYPAANDLLSDLRQLQKLLESESNQIELSHFTTAITEQFSKGILAWEGTAGSIAPNNLSGQLSPLVGRTREISEITNLLRRDSVRLLTLTGIGGTGKTRLAQEIAQKMLSLFADGVFFIPLAAVRNAEFVISEIAEPLGVKDAGGKPLIETLKDFLREKQILLVIDNFEQVLPAAPVLNELLVAAPRLKMLVTSRALLHLRVEREFIVPPLDVPSDIAGLSPDDLLQYEAVELFTKRAQAVRSNLAATKENLQVTAEICSRLDGLPLAIELAAARVKILSPQAILTRLENSLKLLTGGAQDLPAHQQTMRGAIEWSYDLLEVDEKVLFRRLSVFAGGFTMESAESVVSSPLSVADEEAAGSNEQRTKDKGQRTINVLDGITSLVDKSLLVQKEQSDGESRFRLLEVVREYGLERLTDDGELEEMRRNHAEFFLNLATTAQPHLSGSEQTKWLSILETEHDNLRAALAWSFENDAETALRLARALGQFWLVRGHLSEGSANLRGVLSRTTNLLIPMRGEALVVAGFLENLRGDGGKAHEFFTEARLLGEKFGDADIIASALNGLGIAAGAKRDETAARAFLEEGLRVSQAAKNQRYIGLFLNNLGEHARRRGDYAEARRLYADSIIIQRELGNTRIVAIALGNLGRVSYLQNDFAAAREFYAESLEINRSLGDLHSIALLLDGFAGLTANAQPERAAELLGAANALRSKVGSDFDTADADFYERIYQKVEANLEKEILMKHLRVGGALKLQQAISLALDVNNLYQSNAENGEAMASLSALSEKLNATISIAVLPFLTLGLTETEEFLGLGLADALITQLSQTQKLTVRPTNAVRSFTDAGRDALEIGEKLKTSAVLDGNLQKSGERLRVTVQLINVETGATLWADKFTADFTDFFEVQDAIAEQVSRALLLRLDSEERKRMTKRYTENNAAYLEYLKGRYFWNKRTVEDFYKAIEHFKAAIDRDPTYALAYTGLADCYSLLPTWGEIAPREGHPRARAAAQKALEIDDGLAEAHASLGYVKYLFDWDPAGAERCYQRAIELNPNNANSHAWYAKLCVSLQRFEEAEEQMKLAERVDPLSPQVGSSFGALYLYWRRYEKSITMYRKLLAFEPNFVPALLGLGEAYAGLGRFDEALETHQKMVEHSGKNPVIKGVLASTQALTGQREKALAIAAELESRPESDKILNYILATIYACLNDKDRAFDWLEKGFAARDSQMLDLDIEPGFDNLRGDPRFQDLRRRIGLAQSSKSEISAMTSIAVLPFSILGLSEDEEFLGLGLADALITQLSRTKQLAVRPTSAVRHYASSQKDSAIIGRELHVGAILEGNLQRAGERLRVTVQLISTETETPLWAEKFNARWTDIFDVQDEIAAQVANALPLNLNSGEREKLKSRWTENAEAYHLYLKARFYLAKNDPDALPKAVSLFQQVVALAPEAAPAYAGLAESYIFASYLAAPHESLPKAREAALKAIELDSQSAEAHVALGVVRQMYDWDWQGAEREFKRALELNPNYVMLYRNYGSFLSGMRRFDEAFRMFERGLQIDPLSEPLNAYFGLAYVCAGKADSAVEQCQKTLELDPNFLPALGFLSFAYWAKGDFEKAIATARRQCEIRRAPIALSNLGYAYASNGQEAEARKILVELESAPHNFPLFPAAVYLGLNEREKMWDCLEQAFAQKSVLLPIWLNADPRFQILRGEPRFQDLLRRMNLHAQTTDELTKNETLAEARITDDKQIAPLAEGSTSNLTQNISSAEYIFTEVKRHKRGGLIFLAILSLILTGVAAFYFYNASRQPKFSSIAVLPFQNASGDAGLEYLSDGLSESLTNKLAQIGQLKVIAQSSAFRYKNKEIDPKEVGQTLGVEALLTGKITKFGDGLSIGVEFINAHDGTIIWNERYNLDSPDAALEAQLVQNRIAVQTVKNFNLNLTDLQDKQLTKYATQNAQAYQLYLNAALVKRKGNMANNHQKAIDLYNQAIALDPNFALAYSSLANSYRIIQSSSPKAERKQIEEKMYHAITRAQKLDAGLPEVYITLGGIKMNELDLQGSEQAYRRALELNPNSPSAHSGYVNYLTNTARFDEALTHIRLAKQLDPLSLNLKISEGRTLFAARRFDEAIRLLQNLAKTAPNNPLLHFYLAESYVFKGMLAEALIEHEKIREIEGDRPNEFYIFTLAKAGKTEQAREQLEKLKQSGDYAPAEFAIAYIGVGDTEQAFAQLEKALEERDPQLQFLKIDPHYDEIRNDLRFQDLLRHIGLS